MKRKENFEMPNMRKIQTVEDDSERFCSFYGLKNHPHFKKLWDMMRHQDNYTYLEGMDCEIAVDENQENVVEYLETWLKDGDNFDKNILKSLKCVQLFHEGDGSFFFLWCAFDEQVKPIGINLELWKNSLKRFFTDPVIDLIESFLFIETQCVMYEVPVIWPHEDGVEFYKNISEFLKSRFDEDDVENKDAPFVNLMETIEIAEITNVDHLEKQFKKLIQKSLLE